MSKDEIILQALALMLKERGVDMSRIWDFKIFYLASEADNINKFF
jgi:hypothetical protein